MTNTAFLNQDTKDFDVTMSNFLDCRDCENLEEIKIKADNKKVTYLVILANLPKLKSIDLQSIEAIGEIVLCQLPNCDITYPSNLIASYSSSANKVFDFASNPKRKVFFTISQDVLDKAGTQEFINKYSAHLRDNSSSFSKYNPVKWKKF